MQRVKSNMKHFGGNPSRVAFLTQAQADLVWVLHLLSPLSEDLFHQAVVERGRTNWATMPI